MEKKIRVLVVDDSFLMRKIISDIVNSDAGMEVIGNAKDGQEALEKIFSLKPDVVTLDINLPVLDGITVLEEVMQKQPLPVIMLSAYVKQGASITMRALELGAVDFIAKPSGEISVDLNKLKEEILGKIRLASTVSLDKYPSSQQKVTQEVRREEKQASFIKKLVVIGASTGGPRAVLEIMRQIPADTLASFLIIQHMPEGFTLSFAERISWQSKIKAKEAEENDVLCAGKAFVAPAGYHMKIEKQKDQFKVKLNQEPEVNYVRPSVDVTMSSVAEVFDKPIIGVILTGMGKDGFEGIKKIKAKGGYIIAQDEKSCVVWGMPKAVCEAGIADKILPISDIAQAIVDKIKQ